MGQILIGGIGLETINIMQKRYAIGLVNMGYLLLDIKPSHKKNCDFVYEFERTENLLKDLDLLVEEYYDSKKESYMLAKRDIKFICDLIQSSVKSEEIRNDLLNKLGFKNYNDKQNENEMIPEPEPEEPEEITEEQVENLKLVMGGGRQS